MVRQKIRSLPLLLIIRVREEDKSGGSDDKNKNKSETENEKPEKCSQEEMNAMVSEAFENLVKKQRKKPKNLKRHWKKNQIFWRTSQCLMTPMTQAMSFPSSQPIPEW